MTEARSESEAGTRRSGAEEGAERYSLVPLIDGVVVDKSGLDLDGAEKGVLAEGAVVHAEGHDGLLRGHVAARTMT